MFREPKRAGLTLLALTVSVWAFVRILRGSPHVVTVQLSLGMMAVAFAHARTRDLNTARPRRRVRLWGRVIGTLAILPFALLVCGTIGLEFDERAGVLCLQSGIWLTTLAVWLMSLARGVPRDPAAEF